MEANQKVGRLTLLEQVVEGKVKKWKCRCDCGTTKTIRDNSLRYGLTKSCGCLRNDIKVQAMSQAFSGRPKT